MKFYRIDEMALGATGVGSIAAVPGRFNGDTERRDLRGGENEWRAQAPRDRAENNKIAVAKAQLAKAKQLKQAQTQRPKFKNFVSRLLNRNDAVTEAAMDIAGITSQLKGLENKNKADDRNTVTYGVEDDEGNLMKVTVKTEDSKSFENRLAMELGEIQNNKIYGYQSSGVSLAEVLYNMKDEFNIVDVEFPEIPSDIVYNADKASLGEQTPDPNAIGDDQMGADPNDPNAAVGGDAGMPPQDGQDMSGDAGMPATDGQDDFGAGDGTDETNPDDADMGEDFTDDGGESDFKSMFKDLLGLLTAQAQKEKAIADAEAEKARALQAEFTAKAANHEVSRQEELVRMQAEMEAQKKKEKQAKQYADIAKYRVGQNRGADAPAFEGTTSFLGDAIFEDADLDGDLDTENMVRREMTMAKQKYAILPNDDDATKAYKQKAFQAVNNQLQAKLKQIRDKALYDQQERAAQAQVAQQQTQTAQQTQSQTAQQVQSGMN